MSNDRKVSMDDAKKMDRKTRKQDYAVIIIGLVLVFIAKLGA